MIDGANACADGRVVTMRTVRCVAAVDWLRLIELSRP